MVRITIVLMSSGGIRNKNAKAPAKNLVGSRIRLARQTFSGCLTQDQLSGRLAAQNILIDRPAITKIELGLRHVYDFELVAFAAVLRVDVRWLLGIEP